MIDLKKVKKEAKANDGPSMLFLDYDEVKNNLDYYLVELGNSGVIMFSEKSALIAFDDCKKIRLRVKKNTHYVTKDFDIFGKGFKVIGKGKGDTENFIELLLQDVKSNVLKIGIVILIFSFIVNPVTKNIELINILNEKLIDLIGIFISMVFVFIGFFYGDKERTIDVYKKGLCDKEFKIDCYVINLAIVGLFAVSLSLMIGNMEIKDIPQSIVDIPYIQCLLSYGIQYWICYLLTIFSLIIFIIEIKNLTNYYLRSMRNKYFIDAFESSINDRKK